MKFGKAYTNFIEKEAGNNLAGCSYVEFKRLKKLLKKCPLHDSSSFSGNSLSRTSSCSLSRSCSGDLRASSGSKSTSGSQTKKRHRKAKPVLAFTSGACPTSCPGCDAKFFGELLKALSEVVGCFNTRAEQLVKLHTATGLRKYLLRRKCKMNNDRGAMIQEGSLLVSYASMNAIAVRKILKKYDKLYRRGIFKNRLLAMRGELLKSPYLVELGALHLNLADSKEYMSPVTDLVGEFSCDFESSSPTLTCTLLDSAKLDYDLSCSICLETLFNPVALGCGHLFCHNCACTAASVLSYDGPRTARCDAQCALCRLAGVYPDAIELKELSALIKNRCPEYWKERFYWERKQQLKLAKEHHDELMEILLGMRNSMLTF